jgi:hypothetical protein
VVMKGVPETSKEAMWKPTPVTYGPSSVATFD